jgi:hypothetical protein
MPQQTRNGVECQGAVRPVPGATWVTVPRTSVVLDGLFVAKDAAAPDRR